LEFCLTVRIPEAAITGVPWTNACNPRPPEILTRSLRCNTMSFVAARHSITISTARFRKTELFEPGPQ